MELSHAQRMEIYEKGYVKLAGAIPQPFIDRALRAMNHSIGQGMDKDDIVKFSAQSFCPELRSDPAITELIMKTPVFEMAESVLGEGKVNPVKGGQVAIRFPRLVDPPPAPGCHLDGMYSPSNGVPEGTIGTYTMLAVVLLSELKGPYSGNFTTWPGTHHKYEEYFKEHGPMSLLDGMPPIDLPEPEQHTGKPGDVILCHYQIAHGAAVNVSPNPRYAAIFRLNHLDHERQKHEVMVDIWREWPGIREILVPA